MKRYLSIILAIIMLLSVSACGNNAETIETDLSKPITLNWIMPGPGIQTDAEMVWAKFNEELHKVKGFENVTVHIEVIPMADYAQKIMLMQTSGEKMDLIQTYQLKHAQEYRNGTLLDMTPYLEKYAKDALNELPEWLVEMGKVDGEQAILPNYQKMTAATNYTTIPAELEEFTDVESLQESLMKTDKENGYVLTEHTKDLVKDYFAKVTAAGKLGKGYVGTVPLRGIEQIIDIYRYNYLEPEIKVINIQTEDQQLAMWRFKKEMYDLGYVRKDVLSAKSTDADGIKDGNAMFTAQSRYSYMETYLEKDKFDNPVLQIPNVDHHFLKYTPAAGGMAIPVNSEYPDVAAMLINLMNSSKGTELYNLMVYGIEGVHYTVEKVYENGDKMITPKDYADEGNSSSAYGIQKWIVGNAKNAYLTTVQGENYKKLIYEEQNEGENTIVSPLMGFALDSSTIDTKLGQIKAVSKEYGGSIGSGAADTEALLKEMHTKFEQAGNQEVIDEIQRQVDEFVASK